MAAFQQIEMDHSFLTRSNINWQEEKAFSFSEFFPSRRL